jgi:hypothetical protein
MMVCYVFVCFRCRQRDGKSVSAPCASEAAKDENQAQQNSSKQREAGFQF